MPSELEIPASAFEIKAWYHERPEPALVKSLLEYIHQSGTPHLWSGHTHTKPTAGSNVTFLGKYALPKSHRRHTLWAPCPCCSLRKPKYFRQGLIAWFPDEGLIRCVGDKCYKRLDPKGYELAMEQLNTEIRQQRSAEFLLSRAPRIPEFLSVIRANLPALAGIDEMVATLQHTLVERLDIDLWPHVRTGMLRAPIFSWAEVEEDGEIARKMFVVGERDFALLAGYTALKRQRGFHGQLNDARRVFETLYSDGELLEHVGTMSEVDKHQAMKFFSNSHRHARKVIARAEAARQFFSKVSVATVNSWANLPHSPIALHLAVDEDGFHVGRSEKSHFLLKWPKNFWDHLRTLDPLSQASAA